jgi:chemotaxis protein methyltransferase CheR
MTTAGISLTDAELDRLRSVLGSAAGLVFEDSRRDSLSYSVAERMRLTGIASIPDYLDAISRHGSPELQPLIDEVTIQETHFFRNPPQMQALRQHVLPELVRAASTKGRRIRIWSAGCSTGEEPYTIAMMLRELLPNMDGWDVKVIATDISAAALLTASSATYGERAVQLATPEVRERFFVPLPGGMYVVRPEVRELVHFSHHNLVLDTPPEAGLDLVLCRNVTIYFARETTRALVRRLHACLRDGGYLFIGHSETLWQVNDDFRLVSFDVGRSAAYVYRRVDAPVVERRVSGPGARKTSMLVERRSPVRRPRVSLGRRSDLGALADPSPPVRFSGPGPDAAPAGYGPDLTPVPVAVAVDAIRAALSEGKYEQAARLARQASLVAPLEPQLHYLLGRALLDLGEDDEALPALRRAVYLDPGSGFAHFLLAGGLARSGDLVAAAREYRAAAATLGRSPDDATAPELGGRSVRELAAMCAQVEGQLSLQVQQQDAGRPWPEQRPATPPGASRRTAAPIGSQRSGSSASGRQPAGSRQASGTNRSGR